MLTDQEFCQLLSWICICGKLCCENKEITSTLVAFAHEFIQFFFLHTHVISTNKPINSISTQEYFDNDFGQTLFLIIAEVWWKLGGSVMVYIHWRTDTILEAELEVLHVGGGFCTIMGCNNGSTKTTEQRH